MNRKLLPNNQWEGIKDLLPGKEGDPGKTDGTSDCSLKLCCGLQGLGHLGATCFPAFGNWHRVYRRHSC